MLSQLSGILASRSRPLRGGNLPISKWKRYYLPEI